MTDVAPGTISKVLVIDDEPSIREVLAQALKGWGYNVEVARDGDEGIRLFRERRPDVIVTDLLMPRVTGWEVAQAAKAIDPDVVVVVITGLGFSIRPGDAEQRGVEFVLTKPVPFPRLREILSQAVDRRRARRAGRSV